MSKIQKEKIVCACCGQEVEIERIYSFSSDKVGLDGNKYHFLQYELEECPECHYASLNISDTGIQVSKSILDSFRMKPGFDQIKDHKYINLLKAADIYEKNNKPLLQAYMLRLASFYAEGKSEKNLSKNLLRLANLALQTYFNGKDELTLNDVATAIYMVDGNRRIGMMTDAESMSNDLILLLDGVKESDKANHIRRLIEFEKELIEKKDMDQHLISEVL